MRRVIYIIMLLLGWFSEANAQNDSVLVLSFDVYMEMVKEHHPIAKQADLQVRKGDAKLLKARGAFDPKAFSDVSQKYFDGSQYYSNTSSGLKVPTWFGVEVSGGYEQNQGVYLNPENTTPSAGLWYAGISVPVGQGLFIDQRRAALRQAQIYQDITDNERQLMLNQLLYAAGAQYWTWFEAYNDLKVYEFALGLAEQRYEGVRQSASFGDRPPIDTTEAAIQVQNRMLLVQQAELKYINAAAGLSVFLWADGSIPLELADNSQPSELATVPALPVQTSYILQMDSLLANHPEMQRGRSKIDQLEINQRLKREMLKPQVDLKYNPITEPVNNSVLENYSVNNYTWGVTFSMPLFLRKERGDLQLAGLEIQDKEFELDVKQANITYKANTTLNEWDMSVAQVQLYRQTVQDYNTLLSGEQQMFDLGESSLFMVNSRELGYINAQIKLIELITKNRKAVLETGYVFGTLSD